MVNVNRLISDLEATHKINSLSLAAITKIFVRKVKWNTPYRSPEVYTFEFSTRVYTSVEKFTRWLLYLTSNSLLCIRGRIFFLSRKSIVARDVIFLIRITKSFIVISLVLIRDSNFLPLNPSMNISKCVEARTIHFRVKKSL